MNGPARTGVIRVGVWRAAMVLMAVSVLAGGCTTEEEQPPEKRGGGGPPAAAAGELPGVIARVQPSVVTVIAGKGLGSGVVFADGGLVLTNHHVVAGRPRVELALADARRVPAEVVATDPITDLAVLRAAEPNLPPAQFREELPPVGERVLAIGSPLGFENSATFGIVSGLGREIPGSAEQSRALVDLVQTDAAISPGNSGGALIDLQGRVVGINEAYIPPQQGAVSIGFAIPSATALDVAADLLDDGEVTHPYVGVVAGRLTPEIAQALDVGADRGVLVRDIDPEGPAATAGLRPGDVLVEFHGEPTDTVEAFLGALRAVEPGQEVTVRYLREGQTSEAKLTVAGIER